MIIRLLLVVAIVAIAKRSDAQIVRESGGDVAHGKAHVDASRLTTRIPGVDAEMRDRVRVSGDSAQRIAISDFDWQGRVASVEVDEEDARVFWDVKIVPDTNARMIVRYRVDAATGGVMNIREFTGLRGLAKRP
ncbi:MAG TPA: hypothetical protein VJ867_12895 [Gemmatimonadaceae bacterium]|nr:hypothetical protein [Gemmatimonadaceae bacterium]